MGVGRFPLNRPFSLFSYTTCCSPIQLCLLIGLLSKCHWVGLATKRTGHCRRSSNSASFELFKSRKEGALVGGVFELTFFVPSFQIGIPSHFFTICGSHCICRLTEREIQATVDIVCAMGEGMGISNVPSTVAGFEEVGRVLRGVLVALCSCMTN